MKDHELLEAVGGINARYVEESETSYSTIKKVGLFHIPRVAAAVIVLCFGLTGITALAATGVLQGFFKDIFRWDGAVVGTSYENATDELNVSAAYENGKLFITVKAVDPGVAPYSEIENIKLKSYKIVDESGNTIVENQATEAVDILDGEANIMISLSSISEGSYQLIVSEFEGGKKADQPLPISGEWRLIFDVTE